MAFLTLALLGALALTADEPYDFRASEAYRKLSEGDRQKLEQARRDHILIWGALDLYADEHKGELPETLDQLVPRYLKELPTDPFATKETAVDAKTGASKPSKNGWGHRYRRGSPGNRAWVISSVGLPDFPYLAERGNVGIYLPKGLWLSGKNPMIIREKKD